MSTSLYEIVELANGDIVLQRADEQGEPLVSIRFSTEALTFMKGAKIEVTKAMMEAGMAAAGDLSGASRNEPLDEREVFADGDQILH